MATSNPEPAPNLNPWLSIWWKPQATINALTQRAGRTYTLLLVAIAGIGWMIDIAHPVLHWFTMIAGAILLGPLFALLGLFLYGALLAWTGRPLGGTGSQGALRIGLAWAAMPNVLAALVLVGAVAFFGQDFVRAYASTTDSGNLLFEAIIVITAGLSLWSLILTVRVIGAVQNFGIWRSLANLALTILIVLALWIPIRMFAYQPFVQSSRSMEPTLQMGDFFFVEKWRYGWSRYGYDFRIGSASPKRGDLVVYEHPDDSGREFVKRIIGIPGDQVSLESGQIVINGTPIPRRFIRDIEDKDELGFDERLVVHEETLPDGPTITAYDSKTPNLFETVAPVRVEANHYFVMGDNRDRSLDSRSPDHGLIPFRNIVGRVGVIYLSASPPGDTETWRGASGNIRWDRMFRVPE
jgi:signal peptidase I